MRIIIKDREEYLNYVEYHYCKHCGHYKDCPMNYLCPPLEEEWEIEEDYKRRFEDDE